MKILEKQNNLLNVQMSEREFNLIRELESAVLVSCSVNEIPTLTGWTREDLLEFGIMLSELAEKHNINL
ncbi:MULTISPECIES: hypothetical protein [unclassified Gilliamella]|jgi:hypothetical protein|uniref:hypothetical protein n=1 Tax=unclassified Gilliamella TaxID=2685620 RepID=UPI00080E8163|nr:hypothetical protein [Gilliamella apicola]OCG40161.1 hypothetical protein A9G29_01070 [Gilliamella apicola]OCG58375.1 hypothetical protein A9G40_09875 [Gilliamella apicola]OCG61498.1 hypothetical protein A9G30_10445 [Gilliamella apicola]OCG70945.1 hypothetical protein A9G41_04030 [Gilliamella apicola]